MRCTEKLTVAKKEKGSSKLTFTGEMVNKPVVERSKKASACWLFSPVLLSTRTRKIRKQEKWNVFLIWIHF